VFAPDLLCDKLERETVYRRNVFVLSLERVMQHELYDRVGFFGNVFDAIKQRLVSYDATAGEVSLYYYGNLRRGVRLILCPFYREIVAMACRALGCHIVKIECPSDMLTLLTRWYSRPTVRYPKRPITTFDTVIDFSDLKFDGIMKGDDDKLGLVRHRISSILSIIMSGKSKLAGGGPNVPAIYLLLHSLPLDVCGYGFPLKYIDQRRLNFVSTKATMKVLPVGAGCVLTVIWRNGVRIYPNVTLRRIIITTELDLVDSVIPYLIPPVYLVKTLKLFSGMRPIEHSSYIYCVVPELLREDSRIKSRFRSGNLSEFFVPFRQYFTYVTHRFIKQDPYVEALPIPKVNCNFGGIDTPLYVTGTQDHYCLGSLQLMGQSMTVSVIGIANTIRYLVSKFTSDDNALKQVRKLGVWMICRSRHLKDVVIFKSNDVLAKIKGPFLGLNRRWYYVSVSGHLTNVLLQMYLVQPFNYKAYLFQIMRNLYNANNHDKVERIDKLYDFLYTSGLLDEKGSVLKRNLAWHSPIEWFFSIPTVFLYITMFPQVDKDRYVKFKSALFWFAYKLRQMVPIFPNVRSYSDQAHQIKEAEDSGYYDEKDLLTFARNFADK
jgi:hypothetical protein